ncbi:MAG: hypothetical protein ACUVRG_11125 [Ignavibacterium sp.]|uniref:hypothetical protein n=1 Tax=Ignavibacterium sp. TaxID=2651167 RepID=UPI00404A2A1E
MKLAEQFKSVQIIFFALLISQILFLFISVFLVQSGNVKPNYDLFLILLIVDLMIITPAIVIGPMIYRRFIESADSKKLVEEKFILYRQGVIIKLAFVEAPTIFSIVSYLLTGSVIFLILAVGVLILFFFHKPTLEKFAEDFNIRLSELE